MRRKLVATAVLLALVGLLGLPSCYLGHLADGHLRLLWARTSVAALLDDPTTPPDLRERLLLVEEARAYAASIGLEVDGQYTSYVDWPGDRVVTTVVATRPGEVQAAGFRFPLVGRVPYKGFFDRQRARAEAERLRARGLDVCLVPVTAYSTLGWTDDPLTSPMLDRSDGEILETVVHELVHATVFWRDEAALNESAARFVGEEAAVRLVRVRGGDAAAERERVEESRMLARELLDFRDRVAALYAEEPAGPARAQRRDALEAEARARVAALPLDGRDTEALAAHVPLNDACLALRGTYAADLPRHALALEELGGDLSAFVARLRDAEDVDDPRASVFPDLSIAGGE